MSKLIDEVVDKTAWNGAYPVKYTLDEGVSISDQAREVNWGTRQCYVAANLACAFLFSTADLEALQEPYRRFKITPSGVSPRAIPGHPNAVYTSTSNEHNERGAITEEPAERTAQVNKRARKMTGMAAEVRPPLHYGPPDAEVTYLCWGSTFGPLREAVERLNASDGGSAAVLHFGELWPFPTRAVHEALDRAKKVVAVEVNSTAQLATLIRANTGRSVDGVLLRYDGHAFTPASILEQLEA